MFIGYRIIHSYIEMGLKCMYSVYFQQFSEVSLPTAPEDYFPLNVYLPFTPGTQLVSIAIHAFEDFVVESELEWFSLTLDTLIAPADRVFFTQSTTTVFIEDRNSKQQTHNACTL